MPVVTLLMALPMVVENGFDDLQPSLGEGTRQRLFGQQALGDVAENDHAAPDPADLVEQRPGAHPDIHAVRPVPVADEHVLLVDRLAAMNGADQRQVLRFHGCFPVGMIGAVSLGPLVLRPIRCAHADDLFRAGIHVEELPLFVGDDDAVADALERRIDELVLIAQLRHRLRQLRVRLLLAGDVAEHDHAAAVPIHVCLQRTPADADMHAVRPFLVAYEQLDLVGCLAPHGPHQRQPFRWHVGRFVGIEDAVSLGPLFGRQVQHTDADDLFGAGIEQGESAVGVGDHNAVADAAENGLHEAGLFLLPGERPFQLGFRLLELGDVAGDDHAPFDHTCFSDQGPAADVDVKAIRILLVADEQLDVVRGLAVYGEPQRVPMLSNGRLSIGLKNTVLVSPFMDVSLQLKGSDHLLRIRVEDHGHAVPADGEYGLTHAVEYGFHELGLFLLPGERPFQLGFRLFEPGDVAGDDHAPPSGRLLFLSAACR